jgi:ferric-dicitrate binding protein FerR (iron transport regulator)
MGTRFQVSEKNSSLAISCYEGMVRLTSGAYNHLIGAGLSLEFGKNKSSDLIPIRTEYPKLARFKRDFSSEELQKVIAALEDFFQIRILLATAGSKRFSGNLETPKAETAVRIICRSLDLSYTIDSNRNIIINDKK